MAKKEKYWLSSSPRSPKLKVPESVKIDVKQVCDELVESVLKPRNIKEHPQEDPYNYIVDIFTKWYRNYFYFYAKYHSPGPDAIEPFFEAGFARMEYVGIDRFNVSYMGHTDKWLEVYYDMSLDECIEAISNDPFFTLS